MDISELLISRKQKSFNLILEITLILFIFCFGFGFAKKGAGNHGLHKRLFREEQIEPHNQVEHQDIIPSPIEDYFKFSDQEESEELRPQINNVEETETHSDQNHLTQKIHRVSKILRNLRHKQAHRGQRRKLKGGGHKRLHRHHQHKKGQGKVKFQNVENTDAAYDDVNYFENEVYKNYDYSQEAPMSAIKPAISESSSSSDSEDSSSAENAKSVQFPENPLTDIHFHPALTDGERLVPQAKLKIPEVETQTEHLPTKPEINLNRIGEMLGILHKNIQLRPISIIITKPTTTPAPKQRPITIIRETNVFISTTGTSNGTDKGKSSKNSLGKFPKISKGDSNSTKENYKLLETARKYKEAVMSLKPHCPNGSETLQNFSNFCKNISNAHGWRETMTVLKTKTTDAIHILGICFQKMWTDTKGLFGREKRSSQVDVEKAAKAFTEDFKNNVGQPVANFFTDVSDKVVSVFGKRSISELEIPFTGHKAAQEYISASLARSARSQELKDALGVAKMGTPMLVTTKI